MIKNTFHFITLVIIFIGLAACTSQEGNQDESINLVNKVNTINDRWINYKGISENKSSMIQSQFISYDSNNNYEISNDTYVSYFNGEEFIKTELYEDTPDIIDTVQEADGVILSFNKSNRSGMKLVEIK